MSEALESASTPAAPKRRWGRRLAWLAAVIVVLLIAGDVVVFVFNSADATDAMTFTPVVGVRAEYPDRKPISALWEGFSRYLLPRFRASAAEPKVDEKVARPVCLGAIHEMVDFARTSGA